MAGRFLLLPPSSWLLIRLLQPRPALALVKHFFLTLGYICCLQGRFGCGVRLLLLLPASCPISLLCLHQSGSAGILVTSGLGLSGVFPESRQCLLDIPWRLHWQG